MKKMQPMSGIPSTDEELRISLIQAEQEIREGKYVSAKQVIREMKRAAKAQVRKSKTQSAKP